MSGAAAPRASATRLPYLLPRQSDAGTAELAATRLGDVTGVSQELCNDVSEDLQHETPLSLQNGRRNTSNSVFG